MVREGTGGRGEEGGGLVTEIENLDPLRAVVVKYFRVVPWFVRLYFHSLQFSFQELGTDGVINGGEGGRWGVGKGGERGYVLSGLEGWKRGGEVGGGWDYGEWLREVNETQRERRRGEVLEEKERWREEKRVLREEKKEEREKERLRKEGKEVKENEERQQEQEQEKQQQQQQQQQQQSQSNKQQYQHQRTSGDLLWTKITPAQDRENPHLLEFIAILPPSSSLQISLQVSFFFLLLLSPSLISHSFPLQFDLSLMFFFEYPPDAHRGIDVGSGSVKYHFIPNPFEFSVLDGVSRMRGEELLFWRDYQAWKGFFFFFFFFFLIIIALSVETFFVNFISNLLVHSHILTHLQKVFLDMIGQFAFMLTILPPVLTTTNTTIILFLLLWKLRGQGRVRTGERGLRRMGGSIICILRW